MDARSKFQTDSKQKDFEIKNKIRKFAISSRIFVIVLQIISNYLVPDHDARVFLLPKYSSQKPADVIVDFFIGGLNRWDSQHFLHIAEFGYSHENTLAFFPLFPCFIRLVSSLIYSFFELQYVITFHSVLLVVAVFVNVVFFTLAAETLYELSREVLKEERMAYVSALLFCINPASIFFTAPYSESMFCYFSFKGLLQWQSESLKSVHNSILSSSIYFGLAFGSRSNGSVLAFYIIFRFFKQLLEAVKYRNSNLQARFNLARKSIFCHLLSVFLVVVIGLVLFIFPFVIFQLYSYLHFCLRDKPPEESYFLSTFIAYHNFVLPGSNVTWCSYQLPLSYSYVQTSYWNLGFLNYYRVEQIPNFLLAFPVIFIVFKQTFHFFMRNVYYVCRLGAHESRLELYYAEVDNGDNIQKEKSLSNLGVCRKAVMPYAVHAFVLTFVGLFYFHVQILTRMISSSCPVFYWYASQLSIDRDMSSVPVKSIFNPMEPESISKRQFETETCRRPSSDGSVCDLSQGPLYDLEVNCEGNYLLRFYFLTYLIIGCIMFSNFLPWT